MSCNPNGPTAKKDDDRPPSPPGFAISLSDASLSSSPGAPLFTAAELDDLFTALDGVPTSPPPPHLASAGLPSLPPANSSAAPPVADDAFTIVDATPSVPDTNLPIVKASYVTGGAAAPKSPAVTSTARFNEEARRRRVRFNRKAQALQTSGDALRKKRKRARLAKAAYQSTNGGGDIHDAALHLDSDVDSDDCAVTGRKGNYTAGHLRARRDRAKRERDRTRKRLEREVKLSATLRAELQSAEGELTQAKEEIKAVQDRALQGALDSRLLQGQVEALSRQVVELRSQLDIYSHRICTLSGYLSIPPSTVTSPEEVARFGKQ